MSKLPSKSVFQKPKSGIVKLNSVTKSVPVVKESDNKNKELNTKTKPPDDGKKDKTVSKKESKFPRTTLEGTNFVDITYESMPNRYKSIRELEGLKDNKDEEKLMLKVGRTKKETLDSWEQVFSMSKDEILRGFCVWYDSLKETEKLQLINYMDVGKNYITCPKCGKIYNKNMFYSSDARKYKTGLAPICRVCAEELAFPVVDGKKILDSRRGADKACLYLNIPLIEEVWERAQEEYNKNINKIGYGSVWGCYIRRLFKADKYKDMTYADSEIRSKYFFEKDLEGKDSRIGDNGEIIVIKRDESENDEILKQFDKNKSDTLRLLGYLPFENEKAEDQPFLYSQLIGFLDSSDEGNDDMMKISSIITIVRGFLQANNIDDMIAVLSSDYHNVERNITTIKGLQGMKSQILSSVNHLAKENCISLKNSKNVSRGENTWTGKLKRIRELNLRDGRVNGFDINTCRGMKQVQEISDESIMKQLHLDESEWSDMVAEMRETISKLRENNAAYKEINRILLQENLDLKDFLVENGFETEANMKKLREMYSVFASDDDEDEEFMESYEEDDETEEEEAKMDEQFMESYEEDDETEEEVKMDEQDNIAEV